MSSPSSREVALECRVHESLRNCAIAKSTEEARDVVRELFDSASRDEMETMRYMLIEVCVCVFHGFSSTVLGGDRDSPKPVELIPKQQEETEEYRESKLGREPLSVVGVDKRSEDFQYDEYSDDSHGDTSYSDSDFGTLEQSTERTEPSDEQHEKGKAKWAAALSDDIQRQHHGGNSLDSSGKLSVGDNAVNSNTVTCDDLFHALVSNASTVVLPKVPSVSNLLQQATSKDEKQSDDNSDTSSSLAETVSESSSIPSQFPTSVTLQSELTHNNDKDDGFALASLCSEDKLENQDGYASENDSSDFNSGNEDEEELYSDSPPAYRHPSPNGSPNKNINSLLSDNSEVDIDFSQDMNVLDAAASSSMSQHHMYQEEQRYLFEHGNIIDSGLEGDDEEIYNDGKYECDRYSPGDNTGKLSDNSVSSSVSNAAAAYDANLRKLLEATIVDVIVEAGMEMLPTPVKNKLDREMSNLSEKSNDKFKSSDQTSEKVLFTNPVLKKMCRAVAIELSLELRSPTHNLDTDDVVDDGIGGVHTMSSLSTTSGGLRTEVSFSSSESLSPSAREIERVIWPVFSSFLNAEESDEMVVLMVDSLASLIFDNTLQPLFAGMPDIEGLCKMSDYESDTAESLRQETLTDTSLTSLAEVRAAVPLSRPSSSIPSPPLKKTCEVISPQQSKDYGIDEEESSILKSGSQNNLVNQYIHEIRHHETEQHNQTCNVVLSDDETPPSSHHRTYSNAATIDSHDMRELQHEDEDYSVNSADKNPSAAWNVPTSPMDDVFRQTHNTIGSPYVLPTDKEEFVDDVSPSPMDDLFRRTHNSLGSPYKLPIGINNNDDMQNDEDHHHHEDDEFYDEDDYAHNLYGSGGFVQSPERLTPTDRSITTTDALAGHSVMSRGGMSSSTSSSTSSHDTDTVSSPLTHDNYNSTPHKDAYHHRRPMNMDEVSNMDEEFSTNSLSMHNLDGYQDERREGGMSVSNASLSSPSISTRRSDAITVSDLPDNFGRDFFATDNDSLGRLSGSDDVEQNNGYDYDGPTNSTDISNPPLSVSNLNTHYSSYEISMLDHLDKIANSPGKVMTRSTSLSSSQGDDDGLLLDSEDNLIVLPKGGVSPLGDNPPIQFDDGRDSTSNDFGESGSSLDEEDETGDDENDDNSVESDNCSEDLGSQQQSLQTDAAVCMHDEHELPDRDYDLYGLNISTSSGRAQHSERSGQTSNSNDFSEQIPLPGNSCHEHDFHHPSSRHSQYVMSPSELHVSNQNGHMSTSYNIPREIHSPVKSDDSGNSSPQSIYSSRLAQNIPLTTFSQILYNNHKTASQSYSDNSENSKPSEESSDEGELSPPSVNRYPNITEPNQKDPFFSSSTIIPVRNSDAETSLYPDEEAEEDIRLFNDIVASMESIDPNDEAAQTNAFFMAELMKSTLNNNAMSFFKGQPPRDDKTNNNTFFDGEEYLNMEAVSHKLDNILHGSTNTDEGTSSAPRFDKNGLQVSFDAAALTPNEYGTSINNGTNPKGRNRKKGKTVSGDILMKGEVGGRYSHGEEETACESEKEFERSSQNIRAAAIKQFGDMVQRYATPMDLSPLKKRQQPESINNKDFFPVVNDDDAQYDKELYDSIRESTIDVQVNDPQSIEGNEDLVRSDMLLNSHQAYDANRPSTAKRTPKLSLKGTSPSTSQRKSTNNSRKQSTEHGINSPPPPPPPSQSMSPPSSRKVNKKSTEGAASHSNKKKLNQREKSSPSSSKKGMSNTPPTTHIVVIPPVPVQLDEDSSNAIYAGSRDVYTGPTTHDKFGVDFNSANNKRIIPGGNPPPAFSPTSPRKAATAIQFSSSTSSLPSSTSRQSSSQQSHLSMSVSSLSKANGHHTSNANQEKRPRPKSAPRQRTPSKSSTITSNSATAAMAAQRAAKDPSSLLRKSTSNISSEKRGKSRATSRGNRRGNNMSRSVDDSQIRYAEHDYSGEISQRTSSRKQKKQFESLTAPTFSSAVRTLDIAGVDIATVQAMAAAGPVGNVSHLSISGGGRKPKSRK